MNNQESTSEQSQALEVLWTLREGVDFCRWMEPRLEFMGFHCAMGGGVLIKGESSKDLDVFVYPHFKDGKPTDFSLVLNLLVELGMNPKFVQFYKDTKEVHTATYENKRVDLFFVS